MTELDQIVDVCCVCPSMRRKEGWVSIGHEFMEYLKEINTIKLSHSYCSPECMSEGTGYDLKTCREIYKEAGE